MTSIGQSIEALVTEQGIDRDLVIEAMKEAVKAAARKQFKTQDKTGDSIQVDWNNEEGAIEISAQKTVVEEVENPQTEMTIDEAVEMGAERDEVELGDMLLIPLPTEELGRIAAQTAKQILVQKVREAIREKVYEEYVDRIGTLVNGSVKRFERGDMIVDMGNNLEAILPKPEQSRGEMWNQGERIRVVIADVTKEPRGQQIKVSRASAELLKRLFEMEVPEIYDDTVVIKSAVREPGDRAKIAVSSNERDVDPVGACVGMKGSRVQSIIKELRGEKIDIIEWSDEPSVFAANALSPAKVSQVRITNINERQMEVIVGEDQLSLAIGKRGQNVRLATRLVGWDINIVSEEVLKKEIARQMSQMIASGEAVPITALEAVSAAQAEDLKAKGITDVEALAATSVDDLVDTLDISLDAAEKIIASAKEIVQAREPQVAETSDDNNVDAAVETTTAEQTVMEETKAANDGETAATENAESTSDNAAQNENIAADDNAVAAENQTGETEENQTENTAAENEETAGESVSENSEETASDSASESADEVVDNSDDAELKTEENTETTRENADENK